MLEKLILGNFKSYFKRREVDLGKITILIGPNNSGKSSILQALVLLAKSSENSRTFRPTNDIIDLGEYADIVSNNDEGKNIVLGIRGSEIMDAQGYYEPNTDIENTRYFFEVRANRNDLKEINFFVDGDFSTMEFRWTPERATGKIRRDFDSQEQELTLTGLNGYIPSLNLPQGSAGLQQKVNKQFQGQFLNSIFNNIYYIPFQRTIGKFGVEIAGKRSIDRIVTRDPETTSSNLISTLGKNRILQQKVSKLYESVYKNTMSSHNLDPDFHNQEKRDTERISLMFSGENTSSSIANLGGGINQLILLFTILVGTPKKSTICIEEPEIHLHPEKQSAVMKEILKIVKEDNKQIILTTHSEYILYPLLAEVSKGAFRAKDLIIYNVNQDENGNSELERLEVNNHGQLKGGLKGFWDATTLAMSDFVRDENE